MYRDDKRRVGMSRVRQETVDNPEHAARLICPRCGKPAFIKPTDDICWWCIDEIERGDIEDNSPARQNPNQL